MQHLRMQCSLVPMVSNGAKARVWNSGLVVSKSVVVVASAMPTPWTKCSGDKCAAIGAEEQTVIANGFPTPWPKCSGDKCASIKTEEPQVIASGLPVPWPCHGKTCAAFLAKDSVWS
jgi:hypothetical protein